MDLVVRFYRKACAAPLSDATFVASIRAFARTCLPSIVDKDGGAWAGFLDGRPRFRRGPATPGPPPRSPLPSSAATSRAELAMVGMPPARDVDPTGEADLVVAAGIVEKLE